jgi:hypothetical protein
MARVGRPTKLTPDLQAEICKLVEAGNFRYVAGRSVGVGSRTFKTWMGKGKKESKGIYFAFRHLVLEAEQRAEINMVAVVVGAAKDRPEHARWFLERKFPQRWGSNKREIRELARQLTELEKRLGIKNANGEVR